MRVVVIHLLMLIWAHRYAFEPFFYFVAGSKRHSLVILWPVSVTGGGMILGEMMCASARPLRPVSWQWLGCLKRTVVPTIINNILWVLQQKQFSPVIEICSFLTSVVWIFGSIANILWCKEYPQHPAWWDWKPGIIGSRHHSPAP